LTIAATHSFRDGKAGWAAVSGNFRCRAASNIKFPPSILQAFVVKMVDCGFGQLANM
jgi:hypothetical protein